jgi:hypothetical protein
VTLSLPSVYTASNLVEGPHSLLLTNIGPGYFTFDYAIVNSTIDPTSISNSTGTNPTGSAITSSNSSNTGAIAGGVVGGGMALLLAGVLLWWIMRRRNRNNDYYANRAGIVDLTGDEIKAFPHTPTIPHDDPYDLHSTSRRLIMVTALGAVILQGILISLIPHSSPRSLLHRLLVRQLIPIASIHPHRLVI